MAKVFELAIKDETFILEFNMIFGEQIAKRLEITSPDPESLMSALIELNNRSSFLMYRAIIYCGILGHDYNVGYKASVTEERVSELIQDSTPEQLETMFNTLASELGFDMTAKVVEEEKGEKKS